MKDSSPDKTFLDYFQHAYVLQKGLKTRFGIRIQNGLCLPVIKIDDGPVNPCGQEFPLPVALENLPNHVRMIVEDHLLNDPGSDLMEVLAGRKSFQDALDSRRRQEIKHVTANQRIRFSDAS